MDNYIVYMHVNRTNGKKYIGITSQRPKSRWHNGHGYRGQKRFWSAIKCYGWDNFDHIVLFSGLSKEDAEAKEEELIVVHKSNIPDYGYNIENGGVIHKMSEEQKAHLRDINTGKTHTVETRLKMSESHKGLSTAWLTGRKASEETRQKMSNGRKGKNNPRARCVCQYDLNGNFIAKYSCMQEAVKTLGFNSSSHISQCCAGIRSKAYGFIWRYEEVT